MSAGIVIWSVNLIFKQVNERRALGNDFQVFSMSAANWYVLKSGSRAERFVDSLLSRGDGSEKST